MWLHGQETLRSLHGPKTQGGSQNAKNERSFVKTSKKPAEFCCVGKSVSCVELSGVPEARTAPSPTLLPSPPPRIGTGLGVPDINHAWQQARKYVQWWREKEKKKKKTTMTCSNRAGKFLFVKVSLSENFASQWIFPPPPLSRQSYEWIHIKTRLCTSGKLNEV